MKKLNHLILPVFFFGFIYFMGLNQLFGWKVHQTKSENRTLAPLPQFNINKLDKFPSEFDAYLEDNFTFRAPFLDAYHELKFRMRVSPNKNDVIVGKNGHFFIAQKDQEILMGKHPFTPGQLDSIAAIWKVREAYLNSKGINYYWVVAPNKHHVFPEFLPLANREKTQNRTLVLQNDFDKHFPGKLIYPLNALLKDKQNTYFKQDNHWTNKGAFIAFEELINVMKEDDPSLQELPLVDLQWKKEENTSGNLLGFLGKEGELSEEFYKAVFPNSVAKEVGIFSFKSPEGFPYPWDYEHHFMNQKAPNKKKVLVIRDSFGEYIIPFFNETFSETLFIFDAWKYGVNKEIIEAFKPDIVVFLTLEIHTDNLLHHPPVIDREP